MPTNYEAKRYDEMRAMTFKRKLRQVHKNRVSAMEFKSIPVGIAKSNRMLAISDNVFSELNNHDAR